MKQVIAQASKRVQAAPKKLTKEELHEWKSVCNDLSKSLMNLSRAVKGPDPRFTRSVRTVLKNVYQKVYNKGIGDPTKVVQLKVKVDKLVKSAPSKGQVKAKDQQKNVNDLIATAKRMIAQGGQQMADHSDPEEVLYVMDAMDVLDIAQALADGNMKKAKNLIMKMDTAPSEELPSNVWDLVHG